MIRVTQCKIEINSIILSENLLNPEIDLTPLYTKLNITKIKTVKHNDIVEMITENNITHYILMMIMIIVIIALILLYLYIFKICKLTRANELDQLAQCTKYNIITLKC